LNKNDQAIEQTGFSVAAQACTIGSTESGGANLQIMDLAHNLNAEG
jgi:hypothetical protein